MNLLHHRRERAGVTTIAVVKRDDEVTAQVITASGKR